MATHTKLVATGLFAAPREIPLSALPLRLGRSTAAHILLNDRWASRAHCEIDCVDDVLVVRDLGSRHGTYVNGRAVTSAELHPGDELTIGLTKFVVRATYEADQAVASPSLRAESVLVG